MRRLSGNIASPCEKVAAEVHAWVGIDPSSHTFSNTCDVLCVKHRLNAGVGSTVLANELGNRAIGLSIKLGTELAQVCGGHILSLELTNGLNVGLTALRHRLRINTISLEDHRWSHILTTSCSIRLNSRCCIKWETMETSEGVDVLGGCRRQLDTTCKASQTSASSLVLESLELTLSQHLQLLHRDRS